MTADDRSPRGRPRVLCVSEALETRATLTRALADAAVNVVLARTADAAIEQLEHERVGVVVLDVETISRVSSLLETVETRWPGTPAFGYCGGIDASGVNDHDDGSLEGVDDTTNLPTFEEPRALTSAVAAHLEDGAAQVALVTNRVKRRLADARTASEIERAIREPFTTRDRYLFAWVGEYDSGERAILPWIPTETPVDWPLQRTFSIGDGTHPLLEYALRSRTSAVRHGLDEPSTVSAIPFGEVAVERGASSVAVAPLATADDRYGVLVVYAEGPLSEHEREREAIDSVAETASYALESIAIRGQLSQQTQSLRRYERLVETAGDGMYVVDADGHFTTVNDALVEMTGHTREGVLGEHHSFLFEEPDDEHQGQDGSSPHPLERLPDSGETATTFETVLETRAGEQIPCETQAAVVVDDDTFRGTVGVVRDITDRKRRERKLREQYERLDAFAQIVSHDLRNPLGVAQGYLSLAEETGAPEDFTQVRDGLERMEAIIADVLTVAREGEWASDLESIDLETVTREAWENVTAENATLTVESSVTLEADRSPMLRLLENLFRNAIEHGSADDSSPLTIRVGRLEWGDSSDGFYVADDGHGIPESLRSEVFDSSVSTGSEGIGLGLWVVREVAHGRSVNAVESEEGGARFEFECGVEA
ncbi:PAS domain S-box protein [Natronosalvus rutilus]|uniref:histidine kinase n=1 Tax=Natronosalvus rutilus TaxID=2953753 RepID=A0A9E7NA32_9EURY|nr:PAS domain S-box protein [Natronosalvus rutilus]UTF53153.1 PAS domain S-box protein [Natronosalvus rutilus]